MKHRKLMTATIWAIAIAGGSVGCGTDTDESNDISSDNEDTATDVDAPTDSETTGDKDTGDTEDGSETVDSASETDSGSDEPVFENLGICRLEGEATVVDNTYEGFEEYVLIGDEGDGPDVCRIRFETTGVGTPSVACDLCEWSFIIELHTPTVVTDVGGACAHSELGFDDARLEALNGTTRAIGYVTEYTGHANALMVLDEATDVWNAVGNAVYVETGSFFYSRSDGFCGY